MTLGADFWEWAVRFIGLSIVMAPTLAAMVAIVLWRWIR